ncbi:MAG: epoxyqueuosine reductase QueH [Desulfarculus sp.]|nr:epoxyqueuosine reductase QueH [Desulfarculus sp.]
MRVLLHICCAPCALMPVRELRDQGLELRGLFYNPNIQPYQESRRRRETLEGWAAAEGLPLTVQDEYDPESWLRQVVFRENQRCAFCFHQRLDRAAGMTRRAGFDAFSTTLLYSVRQKHDLIRAVGQAVAKERGVEFLYRDWRPRWREGVALSQTLGLYRQAYCGCIYSERDRYLGAPGRNGKTKAKGN